jgi:hypothetical protein
MDSCLLVAVVLLFLLCVARSDSQELLVHVSNMRRSELSDPVKHITFCVNCKNLQGGGEGSFMTGLIVKHMNAFEFSVAARVVYCVPNFAETLVLNTHQFVDRIVVVDRGVNSIQEKVQRIRDSGALAIIIFDDGRCDSDYKFCGLNAGSRAQGGFLPNDDLAFWNNVEVPVLILTLESSERLRSLMNIKRVKLAGREGLHNTTYIEDRDDDDEL